MTPPGRRILLDHLAENICPVHHGEWGTTGDDWALCLSSAV